MATKKEAEALQRNITRCGLENDKELTTALLRAQEQLATTEGVERFEAYLWVQSIQDEQRYRLHMDAQISAFLAEGDRQQQVESWWNNSHVFSEERQI